MAKSSKKPAPKKAKKSAPKAKSIAKAKPAKVKSIAKAKPVKAKPAKAKAVKVVKVKVGKPIAVAKNKAAKVVVEKKAVKIIDKKVGKKALTKPAPIVEAVNSESSKPKTKAKAKKGEIVQVEKPAVPSHMNMQLNIFPIISQRPIAHKLLKQPIVNEDKTRYSDDELKYFQSLIDKKLLKAKEEFKVLKDTLNRTNDEGTDSTSGGNTKVLEDGAETAEKENLSQLAARQLKYITNLENALVRIKNGTYGICSVTGKLISKERLEAVPHTTQSIEAKMMKKD